MIFLLPLLSKPRLPPGAGSARIAQRARPESRKPPGVKIRGFASEPPADRLIFAGSQLLTAAQHGTRTLRVSAYASPRPPMRLSALRSAPWPPPVGQGAHQHPGHLRARRARHARRPRQRSAFQTSPQGSGSEAVLGRHNGTTWHNMAQHGTTWHNCVTEARAAGRPARIISCKASQASRSKAELSVAECGFLELLMERDLSAPPDPRPDVA